MLRVLYEQYRYRYRYRMACQLPYRPNHSWHARTSPNQRTTGQSVTTSGPIRSFLLFVLDAAALARRSPRGCSWPNIWAETGTAASGALRFFHYCCLLIVSHGRPSAHSFRNAYQNTTPRLTLYNSSLSLSTSGPIDTMSIQPRIKSPSFRPMRSVLLQIRLPFPSVPMAAKLRSSHGMMLQAQIVLDVAYGGFR